MYRFLLTPRWWGINVFALLAVPFCVFMGSWQLSRFEARVESHEAAERAPAVAAAAGARPLAELLPDTKAQVTLDTTGRTATATGRYDTAAGHQLLVPDRTLDGKRGFYVLTMLRLDDGAGLAVVRGWLPGDAASAVSASAAGIPEAPGGEVTVTGALQASESTGTDGATTGGLPEGQLGMISAASLVNVVPYDVYNGWITLTEAQAPLKAVPPAAPDNTGLDLKAFQNLGYTGEWFVFAGFVLFMWFRLLMREAEAGRDAALGLAPAEPEHVPV